MAAAKRKAPSPDDESPRSPADARFARLVEALGAEPGVTHGDGSARRFGHSALKVDGKIFAMVASDGTFVVKLPADRVATLERSGIGVRFEAGKGRPMKEWLAIDPHSKRPWLPLAREALGFVAGKARPLAASGDRSR